MAQESDLVGQRFGNLVVVRQYSKANNGGITWECKCDCGNTCYFMTSRLTNGKRKSCGCLRERKYPSDLTGLVFGDLTVIRADKDRVSPSGQKHQMWRCRCKCGKETSVLRSNLVSGATKSCYGGSYYPHLSAEERQVKRDREREEYERWMKERDKQRAKQKKQYEEILGVEIDDPYNVIHMNGDRNDNSKENLWYTHSNIAARLSAHRWSTIDFNDPMIRMCGIMYLRLIDRIQEIENSK